MSKIYTYTLVLRSEDEDPPDRWWRELIEEGSGDDIKVISSELISEVKGDE